MLRILVPVDFHKTSFSAMNYACHLADDLGAEITLLHVINGAFNTHEAVDFEPIKDKENDALTRLTFFHESYPNEIGVELPKVAVIKKVRFGIPAFTIARLVEQEDYDLVIMGTRDTHGIFDRLMGSTSAIALRISECPVMLIHENVKYVKPSKIVFGFDHKSDLEDSIRDFEKFNEILKAPTDFVHVVKGDEDLSDQKDEIVETLFEDGEVSFSFEIKAIASKNIKKGLKDYCLQNHADLLAVMHRKEGIFSTLFRKQNSVAIAQEFHLPVLVFHED